MAFNPFHTFRKYSKTMFAILTIVCMFIFVLSSGLKRGDFFSDFPSYFGGGGSKYPEVGRLDGKRIDVRQLMELRRQREAANVYMFSLVQGAQSKVLERLEKRLKDLSPFVERELRPILFEKSLSFNPQFGLRAYGIMSQKQMRGQPQAAEIALRQHLITVSRLTQTLKDDKKA